VKAAADSLGTNIRYAVLEIRHRSLTPMNPGFMIGGVVGAFIGVVS
jgi:hypothetical protein